MLTGGAVVDAVWRRLLDRAPKGPGVPITDLPDLHLEVDGQRVDSRMTADGVYWFQFMAPALAVRIVSRAGVPAELGLARDPRPLGVALRRIVLWHGVEVRVMEASDQRLKDGFHAFEADNGFRWTDGDGTVPVELFDGISGRCELELHVSGATQYPLLEDAA